LAVSTVGILSVGQVPGDGGLRGATSLSDAYILLDLLMFVNHFIDLQLSFVVR
jgi:hypothetical protein